VVPCAFFTIKKRIKQTPNERICAAFHKGGARPPNKIRGRRNKKRGGKNIKNSKSKTSMIRGVPPKGKGGRLKRKRIEGNQKDIRKRGSIDREEGKLKKCRTEDKKRKSKPSQRVLMFR